MWLFIELIQRLCAFHNVVCLLLERFENLRYAVHVGFDALHSQVQSHVAPPGFGYGFVVAEQTVHVTDDNPESFPRLGGIVVECGHVGTRLIREQRNIICERGIGETQTTQIWPQDLRLLDCSVKNTHVQVPWFGQNLLRNLRESSSSGTVS